MIVLLYYYVLPFRMLTTVTQKGQVTIPLVLREQFGIKAYSKLRIEPLKDGIKLTPTTDLLDIAGTFIPKKKKSVLTARKQFEKTYRRF